VTSVTKSEEIHVTMGGEGTSARALFDRLRPLILEQWPAARKTYGEDLAVVVVAISPEATVLLFVPRAMVVDQLRGMLGEDLQRCSELLTRPAGGADDIWLIYCVPGLGKGLIRVSSMHLDGRVNFPVPGGAT